MLRWFRRPQRSTQSVPIAPSVVPGVDIGLRDMALSGWFNSESGELFAGFPIGKEDVVLDVGCGDGSKISFCARQGAHVIFADIDPQRVALAARRMADSGAGSLTPIVSDSDPLPLAGGVASKVIASEVLEHVDDPARFLRELVRVGQPGALYFLTVPDSAIERPQLQLMQLPPSDYFEKPNHIRIISREELAGLVTDAGLTIESRGVHGFYSGLRWLFLRACGGNLADTDHRLLNLWASTWATLLETEEGLAVKSALDASLPKTQWIIARKS